MADAIKDLVIIGGGPAGLSASIYAARALLDAVTLEKESLGGQIILTSEVDNYPGVPHTDGFSLTDAMHKQAEDLGAQIVMDDVQRLERDSETGVFTLTTAQGSYKARTVIAAGGASPRKAGFVGETDFAGHGVSYCATCDAMFYRGKQVYVIGDGNSAAEEAVFLTRFAGKVTMIVRGDKLRAQASVAKQIHENEKIIVKYRTKVTAVGGEGLLESITLKDLSTDEEHTETYDKGSFGVFVILRRMPAAQLLHDLVEIDDRGYVVTNDRMETQTSGLYVAGDIRQKSLRQIVTAVADGAIAATSAAEYLGQSVES